MFILPWLISKDRHATDFKDRFEEKLSELVYPQLTRIWDISVHIIRAGQNQVRASDLQ